MLVRCIYAENIGRMPGIPVKNEFLYKFRAIAVEKDRIPFSRHDVKSFVQSVKMFATSEEAGGKARWLFVLLILFLFAINALNVLNSYVGRDFMTAIEDRDRAGFITMALRYIGVFAALTIVAVIYRFTEEHLGLVWREWATRVSIRGYANHRVYYRLKQKGEVGNPDQRIADDIRTFCITTLSFVLMLLNGSFTVIAFSGVLWAISPLLFGVAIVYAIAGTFLTYITGRRLIRLNYDQLDKEANFRSSLIYLRANAESVALSRREGHLIQLSLKNLVELVANLRHIIAVNRNVNFFTTGYNWLIQIIPALIVAPMFIDGKVQFGVITQSAIAFTQLLGAFSLIVTQFQSISSYTATFSRLASMVEAGNREKKEVERDGTVARDENRLAYEGVSLYSQRAGRLMVKGLNVEIPHGRRVLVRGHDDTARIALFQAAVGIWAVSEGRIVRPSLENLLLLTELPYLPPGTIQELLLRPWPEDLAIQERNLDAVRVSESEMLEVLRTLQIDSLPTRFGGFDMRQHWENKIPLDTQQLLVVSRLLLASPRFVMLDRPSTTLNQDQIEMVLTLLSERDITYVTFEAAGRSLNLHYYDALLELSDDGSWEWKTIKDGIVSEDVPSDAP